MRIKDEDAREKRELIEKMSTKKLNMDKLSIMKNETKNKINKNKL